MAFYSRSLATALTACFLLAAATGGTPVLATTPGTQVMKYDAANEIEYQKMWANIYGPLELAAGGSRSVSKVGTTVTAVPFHVGADYSVFDHLKYLGVSTRSFNVPQSGSLEFSVNIKAQTPGTEDGRVISGCYGSGYSYVDANAPCASPFQQTVLQGQQAGVVLNMINFQTGQLFDWFISRDRAFALIERLPSTVTGSEGTPLDRAYTQIIKEAPIRSDKKHNVAIRYSRGPGESYVEYLLDGQLFARIDTVGIPLDKQGIPFTGYAPSLGDGEALHDRLDSFVIGHGLFSLLDAFPYQHPDRPDLSVSIPMTERLFGQGAIGNWDSFRVTTKTK